MKEVTGAIVVSHIYLFLCLFYIYFCVWCVYLGEGPRAPWRACGGQWTTFGEVGFLLPPRESQELNSYPQAW